ncbi:MAG: glyoxalase superfamily protein, partial [Pseudomonadota bacterium]|nr:glyoxalase superfamily protein [Pseudomonadota bacterium]
MQITETCPIFRSFDESTARAFYLDWLGFKVQFEHRF